MPRLFHISEEENILRFLPRISKKQWNNEQYVWAIEANKLHNYLLPRACPRICVDLKQVTTPIDWLPLKNKSVKAVIFVPENWKEKIQNCTLFKYEFIATNFKLIDKIAGYYVSDKTEIPISKIEIKNCLQALNLLNVELIITDKVRMVEFKEKVVNNLKAFSIIKWNNFNL